MFHPRYKRLNPHSLDERINPASLQICAISRSRTFGKLAWQQLQEP